MLAIRQVSGNRIRWHVSRARCQPRRPVRVIESARVHYCRRHLPGRAGQVAAQLHPRAHRQLRRPPPAEGRRVVRRRHRVRGRRLVRPRLQAQAAGSGAERQGKLPRRTEPTAATRWSAPVSRRAGRHRRPQPQIMTLPCPWRCSRSVRPTQRHSPFRADRLPCREFGCHTEAWLGRILRQR
jgi:hypothetical protein